MQRLGTWPVQRASTAVAERAAHLPATRATQMLNS